MVKNNRRISKLINMVLVLLMAFGLANFAKADTVDNWQVYINKTIVKKYNQVDGNRILVLRHDKINSDDVLTVDYFRDTPCSDCPGWLILTDNRGNAITRVYGRGTFARRSFLLKILIDYKDKHPGSRFSIFYNEQDGHFPGDKQPLFEVRLE